jgi:hypothetical protein
MTEEVKSDAVPIRCTGHLEKYGQCDRYVDPHTGKHVDSRKACSNEGSRKAQAELRKSYRDEEAQADLLAEEMAEFRRTEAIRKAAAEDKIRREKLAAERADREAFLLASITETGELVDGVDEQDVLDAIEEHMGEPTSATCYGHFLTSLEPEDSVGTRVGRFLSIKDERFISRMYIHTDRKLLSDGRCYTITRESLNRWVNTGRDFDAMVQAELNLNADSETLARAKETNQSQGAYKNILINRQPGEPISPQEAEKIRALAEMVRGSR